jgi:2'-5' RNA ligase
VAVELVRSFIAIELPAEVRATLVAAQRELELTGARVRWAAEETLHLTLKFLGDVERARLVEVARAVEAVASERSPWEAELVGLGSFPPGNRPRVIWAGVEKGAEEVTELAEAIERSLAPLGFPPEGRRFHAHVTLGRVRATEHLGALSAALTAGTARSFGGFAVEKVTTFESELRPEGPVHTVVATAWVSGEQVSEPGQGEEEDHGGR